MSRYPPPFLPNLPPPPRGYLSWRTVPKDHPGLVALRSWEEAWWKPYLADLERRRRHARFMGVATLIGGALLAAMFFLLALSYFNQPR